MFIKNKLEELKIVFNEYMGQIVFWKIRRLMPLTIGTLIVILFQSYWIIYNNIQNYLKITMFIQTS